jgi:hypothetical protein
VGLGLVACLGPTGLAGCGYRLVRYGRAAGEAQTLSIRTPHNASYEPGIEYVVAQALREEAVRRGALTLLERPGAADLQLRGSVLPVETARAAVSSVVLALEYEVTLRLDLEARRRDGTRIPLEARLLFETERYLASADVEATRKNRTEALRRLARVLAERVMDALLEDVAR